MDDINIYCASYRLFSLKYAPSYKLESLIYKYENYSDNEYYKDENIYKKTYNKRNYNPKERISDDWYIPPSKRRRNHHAVTKPLKNKNGLFPCPSCNREFQHAPAMIAHSKNCSKNTL